MDEMGLIAKAKNNAVQLIPDVVISLIALNIKASAS
jgi:hypothetical protein